MFVSFCDFIQPPGLFNGRLLAVSVEFLENRDGGSFLVLFLVPTLVPGMCQMLIELAGEGQLACLSRCDG